MPLSILSSINSGVIKKSKYDIPVITVAADITTGLIY